MNIKSLINEDHACALEHGWWNDADQGDRLKEVPRALALIVCELSEAIEEYRIGRMGMEIIDGKPEGFTVEIADAMIRCADLLGWLGVPFSVCAADYHHVASKSDLWRIHACIIRDVHEVSRSLRYHDLEETGYAISNLFAALIAMAEVWGKVPMDEALTAKLAYNRTRSFRHGGKLA